MTVQKKTKGCKKVDSNFLEENPPIGPLSAYHRQQYLFTQGKKRCCNCRQELPLSSFSRKPNTPESVVGYNTACRVCFRTVYRPRAILYRQRREFLSWILPYLNAEYVCKDCGKILSSWEVRLSGRCAKCQTRSEWQHKHKKYLLKLKRCSKSRLWENIKEINRETCKAYLGKSVGNCIGCDKARFVSYIEKQFRGGMSWDNYGEWALDHYIPRVYFKDKGELLFVGLHYLNTRPLWMMENSDKGGTVPIDTEERIAAIRAYMEAV